MLHSWGGFSISTTVLGATGGVAALWLSSLFLDYKLSSSIQSASLLKFVFRLLSEASALQKMDAREVTH